MIFMGLFRVSCRDFFMADDEFFQAVSQKGQFHPSSFSAIQNGRRLVRNRRSAIEGKESAWVGHQEPP